MNEGGPPEAPSVRWFVLGLVADEAVDLFQVISRPVRVSRIELVDFRGILLVNRVALFPQGGHVFLRKSDELDAGLLGCFNLIDFLLHGFLADLGADFMDDFLEGLLQVGGQGVEPGLVEDPDEEPLGVVHVGEVFGVLEFLGDVADRWGCDPNR